MRSVHKIRFDGAPDLVDVRRAARRVAQLLGFDHRDEVKITAAVSELTRAASAAAGAVEIELAVDERGATPRLIVEVAGPGLTAASRRRGTAAAEGVLAAEKLLERLAESSAPDALRFGKALPERTPELTSERLTAFSAELRRMDPHRADLSREELTRQSDELTEALLDLEDRKQELAILNSELGDTNRGVVALYAELDERASHLRRVGELRARFFSQMSHEFRTPLNSILALSDMLLDESDGPLLPEQRRQVGLIRDGVADLLELVSDLLDLAKMEAGKAQLNVDEFTVGTLFGALRAMIRPLLETANVALEFDSVAEVPPLNTDEAKITQILRNFLSNAVKFTEQGTITVSARLVGAGDTVGNGAPADECVLFSVKDTGIGIAAEHHAAIFEEFQQVDSRLQRKARGTGLGLPLCRRLAELLGGRVWVESTLGRGSTFHLLVPRVHEAALTHDAIAADVRPRLLIVDDRPDRRAKVGNAFRDSAFLPVEASGAELTPARLGALAPAAVLVDLEKAAPAVLEALRAAAVPLIPLPSDAARRDELVAATYRSILRSKLRCILVIDDDEAYRTILSRHMAPFCERVEVTGDPRAGMAAARGGDVDCIVLDLIMPEVDGLALLTQMRAEDATAELPVVLCSSKSLSAHEQALARRLHAPFLPKRGLTAERIARALLEAQLPPAVMAQEMSRGAA